MRVLPLLAVFGGWLVQSAHAAEAQDWLQRLASAEQQQSFQGTFIYERNGSFSTHQIWHRVESSGEVRERLLQADGSYQEAIRVAGQLRCVSGDSAAIVGSIEQTKNASFKSLENWYDVQVTGTSRIANRDTVVLALTPRDPYRYAAEFQIDSQTGLPLKSILLNDKGQMLERLQFVQVDIGDVVPSMLQSSAACKPVSVAATPPSKDVTQAWHSDWLPPGFTLKSTSQSPSSVTQELVDRLTYDDGLSGFSVFFEPLHGAQVETSHSQLGPTVAVSKRIPTDEGGVMATVVGEIPLGTAERIALSMRAGPGDKSQAAP